MGVTILAGRVAAQAPAQPSTFDTDSLIAPASAQPGTAGAGAQRGTGAQTASPVPGVLPQLVSRQFSFTEGAAVDRK